MSCILNILLQQLRRDNILVRNSVAHRLHPCAQEHYVFVVEVRIISEPRLLAENVVVLFKSFVCTIGLGLRLRWVN